MTKANFSPRPALSGGRGGALAHPFLKWAGGKTALLPEILPRLPQKKFGTYFEPFLGAGAVFFALAAEDRFKKAVIGDTNAELMLAYKALARDPVSIIGALEDHIYEEKHYYDVRAQKPSSLNASARAARLIYLNRTCFNGLYRVNRKGEFNVPFGRYENPTICDRENLLAVSRVLRKATVAPGTDFEALVEAAHKGDVVYFDPPYVPVSETANFTGYSVGGFTDVEQVRLRDVAKALDARGVRVLLSNSDTPRVRALYRGFRIEEVSAPRRVNSKGGKRGNVGELIITGRKAS